MFNRFYGNYRHLPPELSLASQCCRTYPIVWAIYYSDCKFQYNNSHLLANHIDLTKHERAKCKWSEIKRAKVELESFWTAAKIDISICGARKSKNMGLIRKSPLIAENKTDTSDPATDQVTETDQSSI